MPFDANLVLADTTADWTFANLVTSNYGTPTSKTRNAGGFVVVDLLATVIRRFATTKRYIRVDASCVAGDDFKTCQVLLAPWPFNVL